jgi:hypothetical protein
VIDKYSLLGTSPEEPAVIPLFTRGADAILEKRAASLLPDVVRYIDQLRPEKGSQYILVNALGAGEYYGPNSWADHFPESGLIHRPDDWRGIPELDKIKAKSWIYGLPTYYNAHVFMHHRNTDPTKAIGFIELATWNDHMKRIELICRIDDALCERFGGSSARDKIRAGELPDVSQGSRVPYDLCSIHTDWDMYHDAENYYDPQKHRYIAEGVLEYHRKLLSQGKPGIPGLAVTRKEYCDDMRKRRNAVLPDGRKIFVYNHFPRFFDISLVFVGADKTAKAMLKIAGWHDPQTYYSFPAFTPWDAMDETLTKHAEAAKTARVDKKAEITKNVPAALVSKVVPPMSAAEPTLPDAVLRLLSRAPVEQSLGSASALGIVLKPTEFDTVLGHRMMPPTLDPGSATPWIMQMLLPFLAERSLARPAIEKRVTIVLINSPRKLEEKEVKQSAACSPSQEVEGLRKISAAYNEYRTALMDFLPHIPSTALAHQSTLELDSMGRELVKAAQDGPESMYSPLSVGYAQNAFEHLAAPAARSDTRRAGDYLCPQRPRIRRPATFT